MTTRPVKHLTITRSTVHDATDVRALIGSAGLTVEGVTDVGMTVVARAGGRLVGTVGLEPFGEAGLLRSLAVTPDQRGAGLGTRLCEELIGRAAGLGLRRLFLLTFEPPFFARLGFEECKRSNVPPDLAASLQFHAGGCATATCMTLEL